MSERRHGLKEAKKLTHEPQQGKDNDCDDAKIASGVTATNPGPRPVAIKDVCRCLSFVFSLHRDKCRKSDYNSPSCQNQLSQRQPNGRGALLPGNTGVGKQHEKERKAGHH